MERPTTLTIKQFLIRKLAVDIMVPESIIESVITHQFSSALNALPTNNSIEISGFGKFVFKLKIAQKKLIRYTEQLAYYNAQLEDENLSATKRRGVLLRIETVQKNIKDLKPKLNED